MTKDKRQRTNDIKHKNKIMKTQEASKATYKIEGEFLGFVPKPGGELKYIRVQVGERTIPIKLAKQLRKTLESKITEGGQPGGLVFRDRISILLEQKVSGQIGKLKLKAECVKKLDTTNAETIKSTSIPPVNTAFKPEKTTKGKILVCRKSSCSKRGGKQLYRALTETLEQLGLQERVTIELTGCQKQCKKAPSLILMPGKVKHAYVNPNDLSSLLETHYL